MLVILAMFVIVEENNVAARELILASESSADETSVAVVENGTKILSNIIATQM